MNVLILGSGGREHALAWKISQSHLLNKLYIAPGNPGTADIGINIPIQVNDFKAIAELCVEKEIALIVVGPEDPLVNGFVDYIQSDPRLSKTKVIGPDKAGAQLEGSKYIAKTFMQKYGIPTALYKSFTTNEVAEALSYLEYHPLPIVLKADGLAAGKGVVICNDRNEAKRIATSILLDNIFGTAGNRIVIEQFLEGIEVSMFVLTDGYDYVMLPEAKDYKRIGNGDIGLNTGGMGAVSPVKFVDKAFKQEVIETIIKPTLEGLRKENILYKGFIFFGLMAVNNKPYVIEYNCRLGDPETEAILPRISSDFLMLLNKTSHTNLKEVQCDIHNNHCVTVIAASGGYPETYETLFPIKINNYIENTIIFQAGTTASEQGQLLTKGGRVLAVTGIAKNKKEAQTLAYKQLEKIQFKKAYFRTDIGKDI